MRYFIAVFIFCLVLFIYLHMYYHLKTSNDLEIYTMERPSKDKLEEICDLRQPVAFEFTCDRLTDTCNMQTLQDRYSAFDLKIRNVKQNDKDSELFLPLRFREAMHLFQTDTAGKFMTENNIDFLTETGVVKSLKYNDAFLRPPMVSRCAYDIWSGSQGCRTPLRYNLNYRNFIYLTSGSAQLKLIPPQSSKYLHAIKDYDNFEYRSPVNPWDVADDHKAEFDKVKALDLGLVKGMMVYIPAYWWYSIEYGEVSSILNFQYRTYMNTVAILPELIMSFLQKQNTKMDVARKLSGSEQKPPQE